MALLERVSTLVRANLNDLVDKAEDPEKMLKQVILDMQNQMLQVKTQVAIAMADHQVLIKKKAEHEASAADWMRKAEMAVEKKQEDLARAAIDRSIQSRKTAASYDHQIGDQAVQVENLKSALMQLQQKLAEAQAKVDLLIAQHRRARAIARAGDARMAVDSGSGDTAFHRMKQKVELTEAEGVAKNELLHDSVEDQFAKLEKDDEIERVLSEIKSRKSV
jgi:phage shock protein A